MVDLVATRPTQTVYLSLSALNDILREDPEAFRAFAKLTQMHLALAIGAAGDLMFREPAKRLVALLLRLAGCRSETPLEIGTIEIDARQEELAIMSNVGRTATNEILLELQAAGHIEIGYRRLRVIAPDRLRTQLMR